MSVVDAVKSKLDELKGQLDQHHSLLARLKNDKKTVESTIHRLSGAIEAFASVVEAATAGTPVSSVADVVGDVAGALAAATSEGAVAAAVNAEGTVTDVTTS